MRGERHLRVRSARSLRARGRARPRTGGVRQQSAARAARSRPRVAERARGGRIHRVRPDSGSLHAAARAPACVRGRGRRDVPVWRLPRWCTGCSGRRHSLELTRDGGRLRDHLPPTRLDEPHRPDPPRLLYVLLFTHRHRPSAPRPRCSSQPNRREEKVIGSCPSAGSGGLSGSGASWRAPASSP